MVAVRSMGLALESLIGFDIDGRQVCSVSEGTLKTLIELSNERFKANSNRIARFRELLMQTSSPDAGSKRHNGKEWEEPEVRRQRKRAEGLKRQQMLSDTSRATIVDPEDTAGLEFFP